MNRLLLPLVFAVCVPLAAAQATLPAAVELHSGWQIQDAVRVMESGPDISRVEYSTEGMKTEDQGLKAKYPAWLGATVPGTVLTSLVNDEVYPEPLYGENNRPETIPEGLAKTSYWYRNVFYVPKSFAGHRVWLNFEGINYSAFVWVNGTQVGSMKGAFRRGQFDITSLVKAGGRAAVAVILSPQPNTGTAIEHTIKNGLGRNGGSTAIDGPTFLSTIGWDWLPGIRDRDAGIWQKVTLTATGDVLIKEPLVTTDLPLPKTDSAEIAVAASVENLSDEPQRGVLKGTIGGIHFERAVTIAAHGSERISFDSKNTPALHMEHPRLWWPNGYGAQNLYALHLEFETGKQVSDVEDVSFGVRKITYSVPDSENLTLSVNGVRVFVRGGDWGLDEGLKRIPRERLEAQFRLHQLANMNMIRNWVGQSTEEDFYEMADKYGILLWDEFFQPNPLDGPDPLDVATYVANARDKIVRFRNHPSIAVWCGRNEGAPPPEINDALRKLMDALEPTRLYQPSSTDGRGVRSGGPYFWREPREFYTVTDDFFKTETGSVSIPTLESIHAMMPSKDWEMINDDWAEHDLARGAQHGDLYPGILAKRYGAIENLADFVRKGQLANYEAFRAMYEGRNALMFHPTTGVITWMSNPAQPSFVWQIYDHDLEPNASLFAVMHAAEKVHIQFNEATGNLQVVNNLPTAFGSARAVSTMYNLDGSVSATNEVAVNAPASTTVTLGPIITPAKTSAVHFLKLDLYDASGKQVSTNFYWCGSHDAPDDLAALNTLPTVGLVATLQTATRSAEEGEVRLITVTLSNPTDSIALMVHLQLHRKSGERVLPVYYSDNYVTLEPHGSRTIKIEAATKDFKGENAVVELDGWNATVKKSLKTGVSIETNSAALPANSPKTGLPFQITNLRP